MPKTNSGSDPKSDTKGQATDAKGNVLAPGAVVPHPGTELDPKLAKEGIYQPSDKAANAARTEPELGNEDDKQIHDDHRENLAKLPPVPAESSGAASQAK